MTLRSLSDLTLPNELWSLCLIKNGDVYSEYASHPNDAKNVSPLSPKKVSHPSSDCGVPILLTTQLYDPLLYSFSCSLSSFVLILSQTMATPLSTEPVSCQLQASQSVGLGKPRLPALSTRWHSPFPGPNKGLLHSNCSRGQGHANTSHCKVQLEGKPRNLTC